MKHLKNLIAFSIISLISFSAKAQIPVRAFEFELSGGVSFPLGDFPGIEEFGETYNLELRYNFKKTPIDLGLELNNTSIERENAYNPQPDQNRILSLKNGSLLLTTSYNFRRGKSISPFIGVGLGISEYDTFAWFGIYPNLINEPSLTFSPRIGVEIYRHFRLTMDIRLINKRHNSVCLRMGVIIGGGKK